MNPRGWLPVVFVGVALSISLAQPTTDSRLVKSRPTNWAVPVNHPGLPNCFQLTTNFYRGAQPTKQGMSALQTLGIRTALNLRTFHSDAGKLADAGLTPERNDVRALPPRRLGLEQSRRDQGNEGGGFGFNPTWQNLVNHLEQADVEKLKRRAGWSAK